MFRFLTAALLAAGLGAGAAPAATFNGQTVTVFQYFEDNQPHQREWGKKDVASGAGIHLEFYTIDLIRDMIRLTLDEGWFFLQDRGRNGLVIQDTYDLLPSFKALSIVEHGFSNEPFVLVSDNELRFDFSQAGDQDSVSAVWDVTTVPLPATLPMMVAGLGLAGFVMRRRKG